MCTSLLTLARGLFKKHLYAIVLEITIIFNLNSLIVQKNVKDLGALPMTIEVTFIMFDFGMHMHVCLLQN